MATSDDALLIDQDGGVLTLTNNDAPRNRMTFEYMDAIEEAVRDAATEGTARLTRCVGRDQALDMILRAKKADGEHALRIGLVHELHPVADLKAAAHSLAEELAAMPPRAVAGVLRSVVGAGNAPLEEALAEERRAVLACSGTADQIEGMRAFLEKRRPVFTGE